MNRRSVLATAGGALSVALGGCLRTPSPGGNETSTSPQTTSDPAGSSEGVHHLVVENHTDTTLPASLRVSDQEGAVLVAGRYELPDGRGIEFADIAAWQTTYTIELALDGEDETSLEWGTPNCGPDSESPGDGGSRNATVRVQAPAGDAENHQISLLVDECDALYGPGLPTGPADSFRLDD